MMKRMFLPFVATALAATMLFSTVAFASAGQLTATFEGGSQSPTSEAIAAARASLMIVINEAQALLDDTFPDEYPGLSTPADRYWVTAAIHELFAGDIQAARDIHSAQVPQVVGWTQGGTYELTVGIENNPGFSNIIIEVGLPPGLTLDTNFVADGFAPPFNVGFASHFDNLPGNQVWSNFMHIGPRHDGSESRPGSNNRYFRFGWIQGMVASPQNIEADGDLVTFFIRVADDAPLGETAPITIALANAVAPYGDPPTNILTEEVDIFLPGGVTLGGGIGAYVNLQTITIVGPDLD